MGLIAFLILRFYEGNSYVRASAALLNTGVLPVLVRYGVVMFPRIAFGVTGAVVAVVASAALAWADPDPAPVPPPLPNVNAYAPISPVAYSVMGGNWYAFAGPAGVTCVINKTSGSYGCSGALPGAPEGANLVSAGPVGPPSFASTGQPIFGAAGEVKALPPNTRVSFREISCGVDGTGAVACVNGHDQVGFVVSPAGTYVNDFNPMLDRPEGSNPYLPGMPLG